MTATPAQTGQERERFAEKKYAANTNSGNTRRSAGLGLAPITRRVAAAVATCAAVREIVDRTTRTRRKTERTATIAHEDTRER
jgi:hypothetical protein